MREPGKITDIAQFLKQRMKFSNEGVKRLAMITLSKSREIQEPARNQRRRETIEEMHENVLFKPQKKCKKDQTQASSK